MRTGERPRFLFFALLAVLLGVGLSTGLAAVEALFLTRVGPARLPETFVLAALVSAAGSLLYAYWVGRLRNDGFFVLLLSLAAIALCVGAGGVRAAWPWAPTALLCLFFVLQVVFQNHYWTFTGDYFDTPATRRLFPLLTAAYSLGGAVGGLLAALLVSVAPLEILILTWAGLQLAAAVWLRARRGSLRVWGPLDLEEADETSLAGMHSALRYVRSSRLGRWLVLSSLAMVGALFVAQFLYSEVFVAHYPDEAELAAFVGLLLVATNGLEIAVALVLVPRLIDRVGVARAHLLHPLTTLISFGGLAVGPLLGTGVLARVNRELIENAVAQPVRNLVYNALPFRIRGRLRALLEGLVTQLGMAIAGGLLLLVGPKLSFFGLSLVGAGTAAGYLVAALAVRGEYLRALAGEMRAGRIDLDEIGRDVGRWDAARLESLWDSLLAEPSPTLPALDLARVLADRGLVRALLRGLRHPEHRVRLVTLNALERGPHRDTLPALIEASREADADVRAAALRALVALELADDEDVAAALRARVEDTAPLVRALAAAGLGRAGAARLRGMAGSSDPELACAALPLLAKEDQDVARARCQDADPCVRAAAIDCVRRAAGDAWPSDLDIAEDLDHPDVRVRRAVLRALGAAPDAALRERAARALEDSDREVRGLARAALARIGDSGAEAASRHLDASRVTSVEAALGVLADLDTEFARDLLRAQLRYRISQAWRSLVVLHALRRETGAGLEFLELAYQNCLVRSARFTFYILQLIEDPRLVRSVARVLRFGSARARGDALEVLSNLGDRVVARLLALLLEPGTLEAKLPLVAARFSPPRDRAEILEAAATAHDPWIRRAHAALTAGKKTPPGDEAMERLLHLRRVPLFARLTLDQLEAITRILSEARYPAGETICREGEIGAELYVLIEGEVAIYRDFEGLRPLQLGTQVPVSCFGEMAVLSDEPRSATVVTLQESRLLVLEGGRLKELIYQMPEIAFDFFAVLTARLRAADARYARIARS